LFYKKDICILRGGSGREMKFELHNGEGTVAAVMYFSAEEMASMSKLVGMDTISMTTGEKEALADTGRLAGVGRKSVDSFYDLPPLLEYSLPNLLTLECPRPQPLACLFSHSHLLR
jgi:hypothetical protein